MLLERVLLEQVEYKPVSLPVLTERLNNRERWSMVVLIASGAVAVTYGSILFSAGSQGKNFQITPQRGEFNTMGKLLTHKCLCHEAV